MKELILNNLGMILFCVGGLIGYYVLEKTIKAITLLNEFADKLSTLISVTYEATHNPDIKLNISSDTGE